MLAFAIKGDIRQPPISCITMQRRVNARAAPVSRPFAAHADMQLKLVELP